MRNAGRNVKYSHLYRLPATHQISPFLFRPPSGATFSPGEGVAFASMVRHLGRSVAKHFGRLTKPPLQYEGISQTKDRDVGRSSRSETVKKVVIPSQCAHWRGNLPDRCNIFNSENTVFLRFGRSPHQSEDWFAMTAVYRYGKRDRFRGPFFYWGHSTPARIWASWESPSRMMVFSVPLRLAFRASRAMVNW